MEEGYVKMENYFVDGTKVGANANPHKVVWAKKTKRYKEKLQKQIEELLDEIERVNEQENEEYGEENLEEVGENSEITTEKIQKKVEELNRRLREEPQEPSLKKAVKKLEQEHLPRLQKYEEQERLLAGRNSYSKTDPDASSLRMKEDRAARKPLARPAYNLQIGTEGQFVVGYSLHQQADDTSCFIPHLQQQQFPQGRKFKNGVGDAGYGSEENYAFLEKEGLGNFLKYNTFHREQHPPRKAELREKRSIEPETVFGDLKHNMGFRRFLLRGLKKVQIEWGLLSIAHNLRKLAIL